MITPDLGAPLSSPSSSSSAAEPDRRSSTPRLELDLDVAVQRYRALQVALPALAEGDEVRLHSAGASTSSYSTVGFNGFPPLPTELVG